MRYIFSITGLSGGPLAKCSEFPAYGHEPPDSDQEMHNPPDSHQSAREAFFLRSGKALPHSGASGPSAQQADAQEQHKSRDVAGRKGEHVLSLCGAGLVGIELVANQAGHGRNGRAQSAGVDAQRFIPTRVGADFPGSRTLL